MGTHELTELRMSIKNIINQSKREIIELGETIFKMPELGFREVNTVRLVRSWFEKLTDSTPLNIYITEAEGIPAIKATIDTGREGPGIAITADTDAVICALHPDADLTTGAVHACAHNAQVAALAGAALAIAKSGILDSLCGKIHFITTPAEELIDLEYRLRLRKKGIITYLTGKPELLKRGFFDDVDVCMSIHTSSSRGKRIYTKESSNGCIVKYIRYIGKSTHAGAAPHNGINALYAACLGLMAINSLRETFMEKDYVRVHPIITKGGDTVNVIPNEVCIETYIKGKTIDSIRRTEKKVIRALEGAAYSMGTRLEIEGLHGYMPAVFDGGLQTVSRDVARWLVSEEEIGHSTHSATSTDWGDISTLMPVIETPISGSAGSGHGEDFRIDDPESAYLLSSEYLACMVLELLKNDGEKAWTIKRNYKPIFKCKKELFECIDSFFSKSGMGMQN